MLVKPLVRSIVRSIAGVPTNSLGSGFSPVSLFSDGSKGVVYDNNDLSSFYLDSAGATPATVNGLVGLQLDKSGNLALGAEVIPQPLDLTTGWTTVGTLSAVVVDGFTNTSGAGAGRSLNITTARWYRVTVTYTKSDSSTLFGVYDGSSTNTVQASTASSGTLSGTYLATGPVYLRLAGNASVTITSMTLNEVAGNHRYQTTTGSKPVLRGTPTGANLVTNGDFASDTVWTKQAGWTISGGTANVNSTSGTTLISQGSAVSGKVYRATFTISSYTSGSIRAQIGAATGVSRTAAGTYVEYITAVDTGAFAIAGLSTNAVGSVDNVEFVDVSAGSVTAPYGLQYDGVDDFMQTAAVDFTATDKMFVCAGVRKLSDAATALILELGANSSVASSSFGFQGPSVSGANKFNFNTSGTIVVVPAATTTTYNAPYLGVLTGVGNIAGDSAILRINGVEIQNLALDQGTGNYANAVLYFGRRGGTSIPYNGLDFGMVICGKTLTSNQISSTERYIAQRTGISL